MTIIALFALIALYVVLGVTMLRITVEERGGNIKRSVVNILITISLLTTALLGAYLLLR